MSGRSRSQHVQELKRRAEYLKKKIDKWEEDGKGKRTGYIKAELYSIEFAIQFIEDEERNLHWKRAQRFAALGLIKKYEDVLKKAIHSGNVEALEYLYNWTLAKKSELENSVEDKPETQDIES